MGKVRILLIKRIARKMVEQSPEKFSRDFEQNKKSLADLKLTLRLRNRVAGYISALLTPSKLPNALGEEKPLSEEEFSEGAVFDQEGTPVNQEKSPQEQEIEAEARASAKASAKAAAAAGTAAK
ncbi:MAG: hypothetical protein V1820_06020 [archaeon]